MNTLKVVADYVPEDSATYLTAGKVYELQMMADGHRGGDIIADDGEATFIAISCCAHLGGGCWRVVE